ncbi:MAG: hypothetical protein WKF34_07235 [Pyrinomonadaceae bacterium]
MDQTGVFIFVKNGNEASMAVHNFDHLKPPVSGNFFDLDARFSPVWAEFDFTGRPVDAAEAEVRGRWLALDHGL